MKSNQLTICSAGALAILGHAKTLQGQCAGYSVEVFAGPDCAIISWASAFGIADSGAICGGYVDCGEVGHHVIWSPTGEIVELPPSADGGIPDSPFDVNSAGQVAGRMYVPSINPHERAFLYSNGLTVNLGTLPGGNYSEATAINDNGVICGAWGNGTTGNPARHGFVWQDGDMVDLELPLGPHHAADDISDSGLICGWMGTGAISHPFIYDLQSGIVTDAGMPLPGAVSARATGVNNYGTICGWSVIPCRSPCFDVRSFIWSNGKAEDLGELPGSNRIRAQAINDSNVIVGYAEPLPRAFVWWNGSIAKLNDLIPPNSNLLIHYARDINNAGQIVGQATVIGTTDTVAVRLTPIPSPTGDSDCDGDVDVDDLLKVVNGWNDASPKGSSALPPADFNHDAIVGIEDLLIVVDNWTI